MKWGSHQYGDLAPCEAYTALWQAVVVDCTGPWVIELGKEINFLALTSINTSPNLLEIAYLTTKTSQECARAFEDGWLSCYACPLNIIHDNGPEFIGSSFQQLLQCASIESTAATSHNHQGNSLIKSIHNPLDKSSKPLLTSVNPK